MVITSSNPVVKGCWRLPQGISSAARHLDRKIVPNV